MFMRIPVLSGPILFMAAVAGPAMAGGLDGLHKKAVEGGRLCMSDHYHFSSSGTWPDRSMAKKAAARSWERFTEAEYGRAWAQLSRASSVDFACATAPSRRGPTWSCELKARPCRVP